MRRFPGFSFLRKQGIFLLFLAGLCLIVFMAGAITMHYQMPPYRTVSNALEGGEALYEMWENPDDNVMPGEHLPDTMPPADRIADAMAHKRLHWDKDKAYNGYTLLTVRDSPAVYLIDMQGRVVHTWNPDLGSEESRKRAERYVGKRIYAESAQLMSNGDVIVGYANAGEGGHYGYGIVRLDKHSNLIWALDETANHQVYVDPDSNDIYTSVYEAVKEPRPGLEHLHYPLNEFFVLRVSSEGKVLDRISIMDAFHDTPYELLLYQPPVEKKHKGDLFHVNAVVKLESSMADKFPMFKAGDVLVSCRNINTIAVIDPATRKVVWAYRGPWQVQHAVRFLPNGHIMLFDNQGHYESDKRFSRILEFDPATLGIAWYYAGSMKKPFYSDIYGVNQRLSNGNTLIGESMNFRVLEVTQQKEIVWSYELPSLRHAPGPDRGIFTATRYTKQQVPFLDGENH